MLQQDITHLHVSTWTASQRVLCLLYFEQSVHLHSIPNSNDVNKTIVINIWSMRSNLSKVCGDRMICRQEYVMTDVEKKGLKTKTYETCPWKFNFDCTKTYWKFIGHSSQIPANKTNRKPQKSEFQAKTICMLLLTLSIPVHIHVDISKLKFSKWKFCPKNLKNDTVLTWKIYHHHNNVDFDFHAFLYHH